MRSSCLTLFCVFVLCLATYSVAGEDDVSSNSPPPQWTTPGTQWLVKVKQYSRSAGKGYADPQMAERALIPKVDFEFHMRITVLEPRREGDERIARIRFTPMDDAPEFIQGKVQVLELVAATGYAIGTRDDEKPIVLRGVRTPLGKEHGLFTETYGFPTDWIINAGDLARIPSSAEDRSVIDKKSDSFIKELRPTVTADAKDRVLEVEAAHSWLDAAPNTRVVQRWVPGEGWWRSFTRYYYTGNPDLEATLVDRKGE